jgi:hypothetical protein
MLDRGIVDNITDYGLEYQQVYEKAFNATKAMYVWKHTTTPGKRLLYLHLRNRTYFPEHPAHGYCCFNSWRDKPVNLDYFRTNEVLYYSVKTNLSSTMMTEAYFDQTSSLEVWL